MLLIYIIELISERFLLGKTYSPDCTIGGRLTAYLWRCLKMTNLNNLSQLFAQDQVFSISSLAAALGKEEIEKTLPNGRVVRQIIWEASDLPKIAQLIHNGSSQLPEAVRIDGAAPAWLVAALAHECHPRCVSLNSPAGYVPVGCDRPGDQAGGVNLRFSVIERSDGWIVVEGAAIDPAVPFDVQDLGDWIPPKLPMGAKVILSGRLPNWGMTSLAMAYHSTAKACACYQPGTGSTVVWTHDPSVSLGMVIPE